MDATQFKLFQQITLDYFAKLAPAEEPEMAEPYLQFGAPEVLDYTSLVEIRGRYDGCIYLTAKGAILEKLLEVNGEAELSERTRLDMCRELSNVLAGNASQAFDGHWEISVPQSLVAEEFEGLTLPPSTFVMPILWCGADCLLVVGLSEPQEAVS